MTNADNSRQSTVPIDIVEMAEHYDPFAVETAKHKWEVLTYARAKCPALQVHPGPDPHTDYWMLSRHADVRYVLGHPEIFSSTGAAISEAAVPLPPLDSDPPVHPDLRKILNPLMSRNTLLRFEDQMRSIARAALEKFIDVGRCEFVNDFAIPLSAGVLSTIIFDDDDKERIAHGGRIVARCAREATPESFGELAVFAAQYIQMRQEHPGGPDDILTALLGGSILGRPLASEEVIGVITTLFLAGLDTTKSALSNIAARIATVPGLEDRVRAPGWILHDMDELLRFESPVAIMGRTVTQEIELAGRRFAPGDRLIINFGSANRDEQQYPAANELRFDLTRRALTTFGIGIHRCLGSNLARLQLQIGFAEFLAAITNVRLDGVHDITYDTGMIHGPATLPMTFDRRES
ncbi:cytochrome P450 [Mycobacterium sp. pUA109]|uniref:cytochrome P450 n=1 Tax=Mycobacterium sp. pUA109 TaxID=3238982 RepID=UPI00351ACEDF